jgi:hypothetical protein
MNPAANDAVETWDVQVTRDYPSGGGGTHTPMGYLVEWLTVATEIGERHHAEDKARHYLERHEYRAARLIRNVTTVTRIPEPVLARGGKP